MCASSPHQYILQYFLILRIAGTSDDNAYIRRRTGKSALTKLYAEAVVLHENIWK